MSQFNDPAAPGGDKLPLAELNGALLLFEVREALANVATSFGVTDPVRCDVTVLDGPKKAETFSDALIFPKVLAGQLRGSVGGMVLGRLGQGIAKAGQSAPWVLNAASDADKETGAKFLAYRASQPVAAAAPVEAPF
jgi:hypothetical protein